MPANLSKHLHPGLKPGYLTVAVLRQVSKNHSGGFGGISAVFAFGEKFIGVADNLLLDGDRQQVAFWQWQALAANFIGTDASSHMAFADQGLNRPGFSGDQVT